jgi:hypothetical protein
MNLRMILATDIPIEIRVPWLMDRLLRREVSVVPRSGHVVTLKCDSLKSGFTGGFLC